MTPRNEGEVSAQTNYPLTGATIEGLSTAWGSGELGITDNTGSLTTRIQAVSNPIIVVPGGVARLELEIGTLDFVVEPDGTITATETDGKVRVCEQVLGGVLCRDKWVVDSITGEFDREADVIVLEVRSAGSAEAQLVFQR